MFNDSDEWFEIAEDLWRDPRTKPKALKLCADANVPRRFVEELRAVKIPVCTASEEGLNGRADSDILAWAKRRRRVLVTLDRHFWDDKAFPLQEVPGVIWLDVVSGSVEDALAAFGLVYGIFGRSYSLDWWGGTKVRSTTRSFILKMRNWEGRALQYEVRAVGSRAYARELAPTEAC